MNNFFLLCHGALENGKEVTKRKAKWEHDRISWYSHVEKLNHEEAFEKTYRMPLRAFNKFVSLLESVRLQEIIPCAVAQLSQSIQKMCWPLAFDGWLAGG